MDGNSDSSPTPDPSPNPRKKREIFREGNQAGICAMRGWFLEQMSKARTREDQDEWAELEADHIRNCERCQEWLKELKDHETISADRGQ